MSSSQGGNESEWPLCVHLTNGKTIGCDFVVSATGVLPCTSFLFGEDGKCVVACSPSTSGGGIIVNRRMQASRESGEILPDVFAAGDVCSCSWPSTLSSEERYGGPPSTWFQMRLWSQAKTMGVYAARCVVDFKRFVLDEFGGGCNFDTFAHMSRFFGYKVVLLGRFNGQGLGSALEQVATGYEVRGSKQLDNMALRTNEGRRVGEITSNTKEHAGGHQVLLRITPGKEYIKVILGDDNVVKGAMPIGKC